LPVQPAEWEKKEQSRGFEEEEKKTSTDGKRGDMFFSKRKG